MMSVHVKMKEIRTNGERKMKETTPNKFMFENLANFYTTILLVGAIIIGSIIGLLSPNTGSFLGEYVDYTILVLVSLLFFEVKFEVLSRATQNIKFLSVAWIANFVLIPTIGFLIASLFLSGQPLFFTGLLIYFIAPCTDWFLGFTKLAKGNVSLGTVLLPINLVSQLLLYPVYLALFAHEQVGVDIASIGDTLLHWFLIPLIGAILVQIVLKKVMPAPKFESLLSLVGKTIPFVIAILVALIFSANIGIILEHVNMFVIILVAVFVFFVVTYFLGEGLSRIFKFDYPEHALLTMTTAARNAPLMLGVTAVALPNQPLIYAALVIGMLVEFPHLTVLKHLLLRNKRK
jgi:ACR3 family arsenite efflux pump ArsB